MTNQKDILRDVYRQEMRRAKTDDESLEELSGDLIEHSMRERITAAKAKTLMWRAAWALRKMKRERITAADAEDVCRRCQPIAMYGKRTETACKGCPIHEKINRQGARHGTDKRTDREN